MKKLISLFLIFATVQFASAKPVVKEKPFPMSTDAVIEVDSYDSDTNTYEVTLLAAPGQGPLIATPEEMARCIKAISLSKIQRSPTSILQNQYKTDQVMMLLPPTLVEARSAKAKSKSKAKETK